jgi:hypothetical protein
MFHLPSEWSLLYVLQAALTIWMLVDVSRRGVEFYWFWIILIFQPFGAWIYFFLYKARELGGGHRWLSNLFHRRPSLQELRHRVERLPTMACRLELSERLVEIREYAEALPHLEAVLEREPEHCQALFALAETRRGLGQPDLSVPLLQKLLSRHSSWGDYKAWHALIEVRAEAGDQAGALNSCRELARIAPSLEHRYLLAEHLLDSGDKDQAIEIVQQGLDDYRYLTGISRRRDRRWVGKAKQLLKEIG